MPLYSESGPRLHSMPALPFTAIKATLLGFYNRVAHVSLVYKGREVAAGVLTLVSPGRYHVGPGTTEDCEFESYEVKSIAGTTITLE